MSNIMKELGTSYLLTVKQAHAQTKYPSNLTNETNGCIQSANLTMLMSVLHLFSSGLYIKRCSM